MKHLLAVGFSLVFASAVAETVYITNFSHTHADRMSGASRITLSTVAETPRNLFLHSFVASIRKHRCRS